jgi:hypothetical protein
MARTSWADDLLDQMRLAGDEPADRAAAALFAARGTSDWLAIHRQLDALIDNADALPAGLPSALTDYLASTSSLAAPALVDAAAGEAFFAEYGPEVLMLLGCYSLPAAYAAAKGAQVLCRTEFLEKAARMRLFQTAQMIVDVMSPGGLGPAGKGIRAAQKVRLLHASIRYLILHDSRTWNTAALGVPINQEDLAGTLLTFSTVILDGLRKFDITVPPAQAAAYFDAWRVVGRLMGIREELIPADLPSARVLTDTIQRRQIAPSPEGRRLTSALLASMGEGLSATAPSGTHRTSLVGHLREDIDRVVGTLETSVTAPFLRATANVLMRHCLSGETAADGTSVAEILALPPAVPWASHLADVVTDFGGHAIAALTDTSHERRLLRWINMRLIDSMVAKELAPGRPLFSVPDSLHAQWKRALTS